MHVFRYWNHLTFGKGKAGMERILSFLRIPDTTETEQTVNVVHVRFVF